MPAFAHAKAARKTLVIIVKHAEKKAVDEVKFTLPTGLDVVSAEVRTDYYGGLLDRCGEGTGLGCYAGTCTGYEDAASTCERR